MKCCGYCLFHLMELKGGMDLDFSFKTLTHNITNDVLAPLNFTTFHIYFGNLLRAVTLYKTYCSFLVNSDRLVKVKKGTRERSFVGRKNVSGDVCTN